MCSKRRPRRRVLDIYWLTRRSRLVRNARELHRQEILTQGGRVTGIAGRSSCGASVVIMRVSSSARTASDLWDGASLEAELTTAGRRSPAATTQLECSKRRRGALPGEGKFIVTTRPTTADIFRCCGRARIHARRIVHRRQLMPLSTTCALARRTRSARMALGAKSASTAGRHTAFLPQVLRRRLGLVAPPVITKARSRQGSRTASSAEMLADGLDECFSSVVL